MIAKPYTNKRLIKLNEVEKQAKKTFLWEFNYVNLKILIICDDLILQIQLKTQKFLSREKKY